MSLPLNGIIHKALYSIVFNQKKAYQLEAENQWSEIQLSFNCLYLIKKCRLVLKLNNNKIMINQDV